MSQWGSPGEAAAVIGPPVEAHDAGHIEIPSHRRPGANFVDDLLALSTTGTSLYEE
jgi:hypothetical protein